MSEQTNVITNIYQVKGVQELNRTLESVSRTNLKVDKQIGDINNEIKQQDRLVEALAKEVKRLEKARDKANDPKDIIKYNNELSQTRQKLIGMNRETKKANRTTNKFGGVLTRVAGVAAAAFSVDKIVRFTAEAARLAAQSEAVVVAFSRIGDENMLEDLRRATNGTVTDLELMQNAVKANNFQIPLEQLGSLFAFANQRARETGESVDYLVQSIITGIGRKSPLILDNLGISAVRLRQELGGVSAESATVADVAQVVGKIIEQETKAMGEYATTTADSFDNISVSTQNAQLSLGRYVNALGNAKSNGVSLADVIQDINDGLVQQAEILELQNQAGVQNGSGAFDAINFFMQGSGVLGTNQLKQATTQIIAVRKAVKSADDAFIASNMAIQTYEDMIQATAVSLNKGNITYSEASDIVRLYQYEINKLTDEYKESETGALDANIATEQYSSALNNQNIEFNRNAERTKKSAETLGGLIEKAKEFQEQQKNATTADEFQQIAIEIKKIEKRIEAITGGQGSSTPGSITYLNTKIKELKEEQKQATEPKQYDAIQKKIEEYSKQVEFITGEFYKQVDAQNEQNLDWWDERIKKAKNLKKELIEINDIQMSTEDQDLREDTPEDLSRADGIGTDADPDKERRKAQALAATVQAGAELTSLFIRRESQNRIDAYQEEYNELEELYNQDLISYENYLRKKLEIEEKIAKEQRKSNLLGQGLSLLGGVAASVITGGAALPFAIGSGSQFLQTLLGFKDGVVDLNGQGTGTSDSILARLSAGESVIKASVTAKNKPLLKALNYGTDSDVMNVIRQQYYTPIEMPNSTLERFNDKRMIKQMQREGKLNRYVDKQLNEALLEELKQSKRRKSFGNV